MPTLAASHELPVEVVGIRTLREADNLPSEHRPVVHELLPLLGDVAEHCEVDEHSDEVADGQFAGRVLVSEYMCAHVSVADNPRLASLRLDGLQGKLQPVVHEIIAFHFLLWF